MEALLGWLPLITLVLVGIALGILARRRALATRVIVLLSPPSLFALALGLADASPPCEDLLDGQCEHDWISEAAAIVGFLLLPLAAVAAVTLAVAMAAARASAAWRRRRRRAAGGRGPRSRR